MMWGVGHNEVLKPHLLNPSTPCYHSSRCGRIWNPLTA